MKSLRRLEAVIGLLAAACAVACAPPSEPDASPIQFSANANLGVPSASGIGGNAGVAGTAAVAGNNAAGASGISGNGGAGGELAGQGGASGGGIGGTSAAGSGTAGFAAGGGAGDSGSGGTGAGSGAAGSASGTLSSLTFSVTTVSQNGRFSPRNIGAIWVASSSGQWIKTLAVWAFFRAQYLSKFNAASGGNRVDAVTSATLSSHQTHAVTWNLKDANGTPVAPGPYQIIVELTDQDAAGQSVSESFMLGDAASNLMLPDDTYYKNMSIVLQ